MGVTVEEFDKFLWISMDLDPTAMDRYLEKYGVLGFPVPFCGIRFVNDASYFSGDTYPSLWGLRRNNVLSSHLYKPICMN